MLESAVVNTVPFTLPGMLWLAQHGHGSTVLRLFPDLVGPTYEARARTRREWWAANGRAHNTISERRFRERYLGVS